MRTLGNAIDTSLVDLKGGTTGQVLSKTSNTDMDFTWVTSDDANAIQNAIVDAKGDLITATAADTPARLAVGSNGDTLVADSAATTGLRWQGTPSASNPVLNSSYDIWQRGTSVTGAGGGAYTADRWMLYAGGQGTVSRQATSDSTNLPSIQYCARVQRNNASSDTTVIPFGQSLESSNSIPFAGKTVTLSFYARKGANFSSASDALSVTLATGTGTDQNYLSAGYTGAATPISQTATLTTTWQRFSYSATLSTTMTEMAIRFQFTPVGTAGAADYFEVTGVQIDVGSVALPFRRASGTLQGELAACQRYYERINWDALTGYATFGQGAAQTTTNVRTIIPFLVNKRVRPTAIDFPTVGTFFRVLDFADNVLTAPTGVAFDSNQTSTAAGYLNWTTSGATQNRPYLATGNNSTGAYIGWSAEL
jgi:hypothetical protein